MQIFFDIDQTILGSDGSLRPGTLQVFTDLTAAGHEIHIWSGLGVRQAEIRGLGLAPFVLGVYQKPLANYDAELARLGVPVRPDMVVDDYAGIVGHFGGLCVKPYLDRGQADDELLSVPEVVRLVADAHQGVRMEHHEGRVALSASWFQLPPA